MTEPLLIGTRGWDHDAWLEAVYPAELPRAWRFCYYSNLLRSVLVPGAVSAQATVAEVTQWWEDCDPTFRFVLECPPELARPQAPARMRELADGFQQTIAPLRAQVAALLVRVAPAPAHDAAWLAGLLDVLGVEIPVCVDLADTPLPALRDAVAGRGASLCWRPEREPVPTPGGRFLVALMCDGERRTRRRVLEALVQWMGGERGAGLYFEEPASAFRLAEETRLIAELMGG